MLQWMGGSRRQVTTSRKSTQKRQKQYFEQRKRQHQSSGLENNADGRNKHVQHHEGPRSLDILSLINLATVAQECGSGRIAIGQECGSGCTTNGLSITHHLFLKRCVQNLGDLAEVRENPEADNPQVACNALNRSPTHPANKISPEDSVDPNEAKAKSICHKEEKKFTKVSPITHPENVLSTHKCIKGITLDKRKKSSENALSVLDLLGDDEFHAFSEQRSEHEAHVAFSVKGLGKMGMETPVHSPREHNRVSFDGFYSPPKAARRFQSSKNLKYITDDIEVELNRIMHDVGKPLDGSPLDSLFNSATTDHLGYSRSTEFITRGCMPLDACDYSQDDFINEEKILCSNANEKNDQHWNDRLGFLDNFLGERKYGVAEKNQPFQMDYDSFNSLRAANHEMYDYGFEDPCIANRRDRGKTWNGFDMSESPTPYLEPLTSRKDYNYIALDEERYPPAVNRNWDFRCTAKQSSWPFLATEDAMDTMSLLSEESCSSSAVRGGLTKKSASKLMKLKTGSKSHGSDLLKILEKNVNSLNKKEMMCENLGEVCQEKNLKGVGNYKNVPNFSSPRTGHFLKEFPAVQKISEPHHSFLVDEGYTSVHEELDMCPFHRTCMELNTTSLNCNVRTEDDLFCPFSITKSYPNPESSRKRSKFDAMGNHAPSACYFSEKDVAQQPVQPAHSYDSHVSSSIRSRPMKPDIQLASRTEGHPPHSSCVLDLQKGDEVPDVSRRYNVRRDEDELGFRPTDFREALKELPKGVSIENSDLSLGNGNTADVADFKDSCSELEEAKDENPEPIESPKTRKSSEHGEEIPLATKERPGKLEGCINAKQYNNDADVPVLLQSGNEEKEPSRAVNTKIGSEGHASGDPSYQVMLESYVLQLLCVQKVLKEASEPNNVKKVGPPFRLSGQKLWSLEFQVGYVLMKTIDGPCFRFSVAPKWRCM